MILNGFVAEYTYEECAKKLNMSVDEVKRLEKSALKKLRHPKVGIKIKPLLESQ